MEPNKLTKKKLQNARDRWEYLSLLKEYHAYLKEERLKDKNKVARQARNEYNQKYRLNHPDKIKEISHRYYRRLRYGEM